MRFCLADRMGDVSLSIKSPLLLISSMLTLTLDFVQFLAILFLLYTFSLHVFSYQLP